MKRAIILPGAAALSLGAMAFLAQAQVASIETPMPALPEIERIVVDKSDRRMELYAEGRLVYVIHGLQLGDAPVGPKQFEGDERTPEGQFTIDYGNPDSAYHLSLHIDYPRPEHIAFAKSRGRSAGGLIMIHGQPNALPAGRVPGDWTDGCIAVSNAEIEALWEAVPDGTPIEIRA